MGGWDSGIKTLGWNDKRKKLMGCDVVIISCSLLVCVSSALQQRAGLTRQNSCCELCTGLLGLAASANQAGQIGYNVGKAAVFANGH